MCGEEETDRKSCFDTAKAINSNQHVDRQFSIQDQNLQNIYCLLVIQEGALQYSTL